MATAETATVFLETSLGTRFLETSLGTRLVVSFPARATTVADLKRQVSAEHAACFPRTGPIVVTSLQIELDGSWFQLTDSMVVEAAFEWVKRPRRLLVEAHELRPHPPACKDAKCGTADAEPNAGHPVVAEDSSQYMLPPAEAPEGGNHATGNGVSDTRQLKNAQDKVVELASCQHEDGITMPKKSSDIDLAIGDSGTGIPLANQEDKPQECLEHVSRQLEDGIAMSQESSHCDLAAGDSETSLTNQEDKLQGCVEPASVQLEDGTTMPQESSHFGLATGTNNTPQQNQEDELQGCAEHASVQLEDGITMLQESSHFDLATGTNNSPLPNQEDKLQGCAEHASVQLEDGITMPQESSHFDSATGTNNSPLPNQEDKLQGCAEHASGHLEDGITMPQEGSDSDLAAGGSDTLPMDQQDKFHDDAERASGHSEGRTTMPQESSDLGVAEDKENDRAGDQQKDIIMEPRGKKRFREEDEADRNIDVNCDDNLSHFVSPTPKFVSEKKSSMIEQAKLDSAHLLYNLEDSSRGLLEKPSGGQKEQWTSGVCSEGSIDNRPAIPPCAESMGKDKSSDKEVMTQIGDKEEPQIAGCTGKSSCKRTDVPHYVESMNEGNKRPASNVHFLNKGENERATSSVTKEHEPCFRRRHHRVAVRKVSMSRPMKVYPIRF
ncbi:uncharacterized protein [Miscanthus floridulus]|uniref:uncharacterized protein n=1 Tax=Miscanthus floridulus TaxID=154761 RepID=UPI00345973A9